MSSIFTKIMNEGQRIAHGYTVEDWKALGRGELDEEDAEKLIAAGYENIIQEEEDD